MAKPTKKQSAPVEAQGPVVQDEMQAYVQSELARDALVRFCRVSDRRTMVFLGAPLLISLILNAALLTRKPETRYIPTDADGRILPLVMLDKPVTSDANVSQWAADTIQRSFTMDYVNYRKQLSAVEGEYTTKGWKDFETMLTQASFLDTITSNSYVTTASVTGAPQILSSGIVQNGSGWIYAWKIQIPMHIVFRNASGPIEKSYQVDILVIRQPETHEKNGLGIAQVIAQ